MGFYLDTSVLVSIYLSEPRTPMIIQFLRETSEALFISRLVEAEFYAVLGIKKRTKHLSSKQFLSIANLFEHHIEQLFFQKMHVSDEVFNVAIQFLSKHNTNLRTLDALHLACNKILGTTLVTGDAVLAQCAHHFKEPVKLI